MAAELFFLPFPVAFNSNGIVVPGALIHFYATGTSTHVPVYTTSALTTELANPVEANGSGRFPTIYLNDAITYRVYITDADGAPLGVDLDPYLTPLLSFSNSVAADAASAEAAAEAAEESADEAAASAASASSSAVSAAIDEAAAALYAAAAEAFADGLYEDTTAGLAGTANGGFFLVKGSGNAFATLYKDVAGVATAQNLEIPSLAGLQALQTEAASGRTAADIGATPGDPLALWSIDGFVAETSTIPAHIPNLALASPDPSANWKRAPRRAFGNVVFYTPNSVTVVDNVAAGVSGETDAATVSGTGSWYLLLNETLPSQEWTIVVTAKRNGGSNQQFAFTTDVVTPVSPQTATSTFQRFAYTFTGTGAGMFGIRSVAGPVAANLIIDSIEIFAGASDLGASLDDGNIYFPASAAVTAGVLAGGGFAALPEAATMDEWTVSALLKEVDAGAGSYPWAISDATNYTSFNFGIANSAATPAHNPPSAVGFLYMSNRMTGQAGVANRGGLWQFAGGEHHLFTHRWDGTALEFWLDDIRMFRDESIAGDIVLRDLMMFLDINGIQEARPAGLIGIWDRALDDAEMRNFASYQRMRNSEIVATGYRTNRILAIEGDSNHGGFEFNCWPWVVGPSLSPAVFGTVYAVNASSLASLIARATFVDGVVPPQKRGRTFMLSVGTGTNDLYNYTGGAAQYITDMRAYCIARAAAGWEVLLWTIPPRGDAQKAVHNSRRATVNADFRTNWTLYGLTSADRVIDFADEPTLDDDDSHTTSPALWADTLHPSGAGYVLMAGLAATAINLVP